MLSLHLSLRLTPVVILFNNMNTAQLTECLKKDAIIRQFQPCVISIDQISDVIYPPAVFIVNSDHSTYPGLHWLAMFFQENGRGEFWDSLGRHPKQYGMENVMLENDFEYIFILYCIFLL